MAMCFIAAGDLVECLDKPHARRFAWGFFVTPRG
ncbi:hypothetical protein phi3MF5_05 [Pseudomonas phage vB_PsyP_3MF5]|nr:hypothetical protein KMB82_gp05 [Pseudomonas phage vB_PsyP_3MF5]QLI47556.1 hypothetical protein phi3MF5_05 [Pseudomonas phage vB_PsyP_3MF5]